MKITLSDTVINDIRESISTSKIKLDANKNSRKTLISKIRKAKEEIRSAETVLSCCQNSTVTESKTCAFFMSNELMRKRVALNNLRKELLLHELLRDVELARFRTLHASLDKLKVPFDPVMYKKKHG